MSKKRCTFVLLMLAALALGSILLAACARPGTPGASAGTGPSSSATSSSGGGEPTVHLGAANFVQPSVDVPKGSKLMLIEDVAVLHILSNGSWVNGSPRPAKEPGAPTINNLQVSGNVEIGPFPTAGTFHIYCSIHENMNLTIIVK